MNKGTAIVGFLMSFIAGMFLMYGLDKSKSPDIQAETGSATGIPDQSTASVPVSSRDPQWGKADAPVTIVTISDFQCPFCSRVEPTLKQIRDTYGPDKVRMVWKNNPLPFHKDARPTAEAAMAVFGLKGSDAFWKFHDTAFANQQTLTPENFDKWAVEAGVDKAKFDAAVSSKKFSAKIDEDLALSTKIGANGTPAFRINGVTVSGAQPFDKFKEVIDAQLGEAQKMVASGTRKGDVYVALTNKNQTAQPDKPAADKPKPDAEEEDKSVWKVSILDDDPVKGPKDALVTLVIFLSDFQCPVLQARRRHAEAGLGRARQRRALRLERQPTAVPPACQAVRDAGSHGVQSQGRQGLLGRSRPTLRPRTRSLEDDDLKGIAEKVGLSWDTVKTAIDGNKFADKFDASIDLASDSKGASTAPLHFFINGVRLSGSAAVRELLEASSTSKWAKAKAVVARGVPRAKVYDEIMKEGKEPPPPEKKDIAAPDSSDPVKGGPNAKVVIQEFSDFQCPFCKRVEPTVQAIEKAYGNKIKIVWRHMPLPFHKNAPMAAEAAQEVFAQKGSAAFWTFHDAIFSSDGVDEARTDRRGAREASSSSGPRHGQVQGCARRQHAQGQDRR